ncbi:glycosyltransferase family 4 protein [Psychroflexus sp. YR1-1]|uniref:Glycosyltransferase family 4 protein n=1 Tax=Psychroflexus aurantiacus TaxID=2709310 RepID=A0A6B3R061_9FLAO|nr:glycosyltransferase family 4 protein [Psychroflexus aurantiacus]NEV93926.1 glycosyltransferase family 4 protein [Psychroflexus aurantiacus]
MTYNPKPANNLRVLQLIDSLEAGGAERMAVNLANALVGNVEFSGLVATRREGDLKHSISPQVNYLFLDRKKRIDFNALVRLRNFAEQHSITIVHAHATSFFMAFLLKLLKPGLKVIWHDHYGESEHLEARPYKFIRLACLSFSHIISVNPDLKQWARDKLKFSKVSFVRNFTQSSRIPEDRVTCLGKASEEVKIVQIANFRPQKAHSTAFEAMRILKEQGFRVSLHCIGAYSEKDPYVKSLESYIVDNKLSDVIKLYGSRSDISFILEQADIGLLSSRSEGLPLSLLEYTQAKLPVVVTDVGQCAEVVGEFGQVVKPDNAKALAEAIAFYIKNKAIAQNHARALHIKMKKEFDSERIISEIIAIYKAALK